MTTRMMGLLVLIAPLLLAASAKDVDYTAEGHLTFCQFGPKVRVIESKATQPRDLCTGWAKVQGVLWSCAPADQNDPLILRFRNELTQEGQLKCLDHCASRAKGCEGSFKEPLRCGLQTDREDAVVMGARLGCRKDCSGKAFSYCSLYDAGFRSEDPPRTAKQLPNCECRWTAKGA